MGGIPRKPSPSAERAIQLSVCRTDRVSSSVKNIQFLSECKYLHGADKRVSCYPMTVLYNARPAGVYSPDLASYPYAVERSKDAEDLQKPQHNNNDDDIQDFFNFPVRGDVGIYGLKQDPNQDQGDD